jgi:hypothetical protein
MIKPARFCHATAETLIGLGQALCERFDGRVPRTLDELHAGTPGSAGSAACAMITELETLSQESHIPAHAGNAKCGNTALNLSTFPGRFISRQLTPCEDPT